MVNMTGIDSENVPRAGPPAPLQIGVRSRSELAEDIEFQRADGVPVEWRITDGVTGYAEAVAEMEARVADIAAGAAPELVWLVEHPALYTAGTSANPADLLMPDRFPVHATGRGGEYTYHGPGQRVIYVMLDLKQRRQDVRQFVAALEAWMIATLWEFGLRGLRREERVGVWVARPDKPPIAVDMPAEDKIAAIGIRLRKWVSFHGTSFNVEPDLSHFQGIVPCGVAGYGVTSLVDLGLAVSMAETDVALRRTFEPIFGATLSRGDRREESQAVGSTAKLSRASPAHDSMMTSVTWAPCGPIRQRLSMSSTSWLGPANTASTEPSARLRTKPVSPARVARWLVQFRYPTP